MRRLSLIPTLLIAAGLLSACGGGGDDPASATGQSIGPDARALAVSIDAARTLIFNYGPVTIAAKIIVGPAAGQVQVFGLPDAPDGTVYSNIRAIRYTSGAGNDSLQFEITQAADFDLHIDTGPGNVELDVKWIVPAGAPAGITPGVHMLNGPGDKKVQVQLESFATDVAFGVTGTFGAGNAEFRGEAQFKVGTINARPTFDIDFGAGMTKADFMIDSEARNLFATVAPRNASELGVKVLADDPSDSATVNFRPVGVAGGTKISFEMVSGAPLIALNHNVRGGAGMDEVKLLLTTLSAARLTSMIAIDLGQMGDKLDLGYFNLPGGTLTLDGSVVLGGGDDEAKLEATGGVTDRATLNCGDGIDKATGWRNAVACELN
jgi:hypothetical protein